MTRIKNIIIYLTTFSLIISIGFNVYQYKKYSKILEEKNNIIITTRYGNDFIAAKYIELKESCRQQFTALKESCLNLTNDIKQQYTYCVEDLEYCMRNK